MNPRPAPLALLLALGCASSAAPASEAPQSGPSLTKEEISTTIRAELPRILACYEAALKTQPDLRGKVKVRFTIAADGGVQKAQAHSGTTLDDAPTVDCIVDVAHGLKFPPLRNGGVMVVTYPFVLDSK